MPKILRKTSVLFAGSAPSSDLAQFGSTVANTPSPPIFSTDPAVLQANAAWPEGWQDAVFTGDKAPVLEEMNAVCYVLSYLVSYIYEMGIPEWDSGTTYYLNSVVQDNAGLGQWFVSLQNNNTGNTPPVSSSNSFWQWVNPPSAQTVPTQTVLTSGSGTYTPPAGVKWIKVRFVGGGGGGAAGETSGSHGGSNGGNTVFNGVTANGGTGGTGNNGTVPTVGGAGGTGGTGTASLRIPGQTGGPTANNLQSGWGWGGNSILGMGGAPTTRNTAGKAGTNYGGGGGAGQDADYGGGGGGGGEYAELLIANPGAVAYAVGAAGAGATAGVQFGGNGAPGVIIIEEHYNF